jgi:hypothetical protein
MRHLLLAKLIRIMQTYFEMMQITVVGIAQAATSLQVLASHCTDEQASALIVPL